MVAILNISNCSIGRQEALVENFSSTIENGQLIIFTGENGTGKSTFLKTIAGLIKPLKGHIIVNNKAIHSLSYNEKARLIAFVNANKISEEYIKVSDLVALGRYPFNEKLKMNDAVQQALATMGISHLADKYINNISDGEFQKANIARALAQDTPIILLDEPSAFLDYPSKKQLFKNLRNIALTQHKIIICPTHDIELSEFQGTLFWHLENKSIIESQEQKAWR